MRPLSLTRPSAWPAEAGPAAAGSGSAGAGRGGSPSGELGCGGPGRAGTVTGWSPFRCGVSGGGQRVVAELGQDVAGLAEDLAGLPQGGPLAAAAFFYLGVVAVIRGRGPGVGLAGLV